MKVVVHTLYNYANKSNQILIQNCFKRILNNSSTFGIISFEFPILYFYTHSKQYEDLKKMIVYFCTLEENKKGEKSRKAFSILPFIVHYYNDNIVYYNGLKGIPG